MEPVPAFRNHLPVQIRFGEGAVGALPDVLAAERAGRVFLVIDAGLDELVPAVGEALEALPPTVRFEKDPGEPTIALVEDCAAALRHSRAHGVVAIGGGSTMDT